MFKVTGVTVYIPDNAGRLAMSRVTLDDICETASSS